MSTQWIDVTNGDGETFDAYLALPPPVTGPGWYWYRKSGV